MNIGSDKKLFKIVELADYLNISTSTMRRLIEGRKIPFYKIGGGIRFDQNEIKEFLNNNRVDPI